MNFATAFSETIGKETAAPAAPAASAAPAAPAASGNDFTSDDMKSYVDAKFEALKSDLLHEMQSLRQVETPKETDNMGTNNSEENKKEELNNASSTDLSDNKHPGQ